ncbi:MAG: hypothetical protein ACRDEA_00225 [Microcystaceae cyanobacterium]
MLFLETFSQENSPFFQKQIQADLGYFRHGSSLLEQAIASIRGIVEIERETLLQRCLTASPVRGRCANASTLRSVCPIPAARGLGERARCANAADILSLIRLSYLSVALQSFLIASLYWYAFCVKNAIGTDSKH